VLRSPAELAHPLIPIKHGGGHASLKLDLGNAGLHRLVWDLRRYIHLGNLTLGWNDGCADDLARMLLVLIAEYDTLFLLMMAIVPIGTEPTSDEASGLRAGLSSFGELERVLGFYYWRYHRVWHCLEDPIPHEEASIARLRIRGQVHLARSKDLPTDQLLVRNLQARVSAVELAGAQELVGFGCVNEVGSQLQVRSCPGRMIQGRVRINL